MEIELSRGSVRLRSKVILRLLHQHEKLSRIVHYPLAESFRIDNPLPAQASRSVRPWTSSSKLAESMN